MKTKTFYAGIVIGMTFIANFGAQAQDLVVRTDNIDLCCNGIATVLEISPSEPSFSDVAEKLRQHPGVDVGIRLIPQGNNMMDIEKSLREQIEISLKAIPQVTHISRLSDSGEDILRIVDKVSAEYGLPFIGHADAEKCYEFKTVSYGDDCQTPAQRKDGMLKMLRSLKKGKKYMICKWSAQDELLKDADIKALTDELGIRLIDVNYLTKRLPRTNAGRRFNKASEKYLEDLSMDKEQDIHSIMVLKDGNVVFEKWMSSGNELVPHVLHSVSKTFTSAAVGLAISEGRLKLDDKVTDFFPDKLPADLNGNFTQMTIRNLLTMNTGHEKDPSKLRQTETDWEKAFFETPLNRKPGTIFCYNSLATYMLASILQRVTGESLTDYLYPRLFRPIGINNVHWDESPAGVKTGGWGLYLKTEDLAKFGQLLLQKGNWNGKQVIPAEWVKEMSSAQVPCVPAGKNSDMLEELQKTSERKDWLQGYGYQMWRCRHNAFRADGAYGQYIIVIPDKNAVVVTTAKVRNMQNEINLIWNNFLPVL